MPTFLLGVVSLIVLAVAMVSVLPRVWHRSDLTETNSDWLTLRQRELKGDSESLREEAALRGRGSDEESDGSPGAPPARELGRMLRRHSAAAMRRIARGAEQGARAVSQEAQRLAREAQPLGAQLEARLNRQLSFAKDQGNRRVQQIRAALERRKMQRQLEAGPRESRTLEWTSSSLTRSTRTRRATCARACGRPSCWTKRPGRALLRERRSVRRGGRRGPARSELSPSRGRPRPPGSTRRLCGRS